MRKIASCLTLVLLMLSLAGCGLGRLPDAHIIDEETPSESTPVPTEPAPREGGELRVPLTAPDTFNPLLTKSSNMLSFLSLIFESLVAYDENSKPVPCLASGWEVSPDGRLWVFDLRKGVKWHNGQDFTGEDVIFTFEALKSGALESFYYNDLFENVLEYGLRNADPYSFYIRLAEPTYKILDLLTFPVLPKDVYISAENMTENKDDFSLIPVGTGPYKVDPNHPFDGSEIKLVQNKNWWNGSSYIKSILGKSFASNEEARNAFNDGEIDLVDTAVVYANTRLNRSNSSHYKYLTSIFEFLALNNNNPLFQDKNIKKAMAYAIDRKDIISKVYLNNAETVDVPIPSNSWLYDSSYRIYDYDADQARRLLAEAGWKDSDGDGILDQDIDGKKVDLAFTLLINSDNDYRRDTANLIARQLELVGFKVTVEMLPWEKLRDEVMPKGDFDAVLTAYSLDYVHDLRFAFHSSQIGNGLSNFIRYKNEELDNLLDSAAKAYTEEDRLKAYLEIQKHFTEQLPIISLYFRTGSLLVDDRVKGVQRISELNIYKNISDWFLTN
ncbi:MAG TPA: peptide ABC transporter substrate-binding protein [Clostridiales bacterium]|nr:peptide ABC transporter substrate-binding protein [Clostridiales bacterium]